MNRLWVKTTPEQEQEASPNETQEIPEGQYRDIPARSDDDVRDSGVQEACPSPNIEMRQKDESQGVLETDAPTVFQPVEERRRQVKKLDRQALEKFIKVSEEKRRREAMEKRLKQAEQLKRRNANYQYRVQTKIKLGQLEEQKRRQAEEESLRQTQENNITQAEEKNRLVTKRLEQATAEKVMQERVFNASKDRIQELRELIRERYRLDVKIWRKRDVLRANRTLVMQDCKLADEVMKEIYSILNTWKEDLFSAEEWRVAKKIKDGIYDSGQRVVWTETPPWELDKFPSSTGSEDLYIAAPDTMKGTEAPEMPKYLIQEQATADSPPHTGIAQANAVVTAPSAEQQQIASQFHSLGSEAETIEPQIPYDAYPTRSSLLTDGKSSSRLRLPVKLPDSVPVDGEVQVGGSHEWVSLSQKLDLQELQRDHERPSKARQVHLQELQQHPDPEQSDNAAAAEMAKRLRSERDPQALEVFLLLYLGKTQEERKPLLRLVRIDPDVGALLSTTALAIGSDTMKDLIDAELGKIPRPFIRVDDSQAPVSPTDHLADPDMAVEYTHASGPASATTSLDQALANLTRPKRVTLVTTLRTNVKLRSHLISAALFVIALASMVHAWIMDHPLNISAAMAGVNIKELGGVGSLLGILFVYAIATQQWYRRQWYRQQWYRQKRSALQLKSPKISRQETLWTYAGVHNTILKELLRMLRPGVKPGSQRLEWICSCGSAMYGDYDYATPDTVPGSMLFKSLSRYGVISDSTTKRRLADFFIYPTRRILDALFRSGPIKGLISNRKGVALYLVHAYCVALAVPNVSGDIAVPLGLVVLGWLQFAETLTYSRKFLRTSARQRRTFRGCLALMVLGDVIFYSQDRAMHVLAVLSMTTSDLIWLLISTPWAARSNSLRQSPRHYFPSLDAIVKALHSPRLRVERVPYIYRDNGDSWIQKSEIIEHSFSSLEHPHSTNNYDKNRKNTFRTSVTSSESTPVRSIPLTEPEDPDSSPSSQNLGIDLPQDDSISAADNADDTSQGTSSSSLSRSSTPSDSSDLSKVSSSTSISLPSSEAVPIQSYLELCVNRNKYLTRIGEIPIASAEGKYLVKSDFELFAKIQARYKELARGGMLRYLYRPRDIRFVHFCIRRGINQAGIYNKEEHEIPPEDEVKEGRYHYYECPLPQMPPMDKRTFFHYFWDHASHAPTNDMTFHDRLPKKLGRSILMASSSTPLTMGWGIHIIEGVNWPLFPWIVVVLLATTLIVAAVYDAVFHGQESGFNIGQLVFSLLMAVLSSLVSYAVDTV